MRVSVFAIPALMVILWLEGLFPFLTMLLSALLHELGHLSAMLACGRKPRRIDILPMGALIVCPEGIPYRQELFIALAGPIASLFGAAVAAVWFLCIRSPFALFAFVVNCVLALFNLLPERKLDGGKALYCFLATKKDTDTAERICSAVSAASKCVFMAISVVFLAATNANLGVLLLSAVLLIQVASD